jgi:hypothetical protein
MPRHAPPPAMPFNWIDTNTSADPMRFYRIKVGPALAVKTEVQPPGVASAQCVPPAGLRFSGSTLFMTPLHLKS